MGIVGDVAQFAVTPFLDRRNCLPVGVTGSRLQISVEIICVLGVRRHDDRSVTIDGIRIGAQDSLCRDARCGDTRTVGLDVELTLTILQDDVDASDRLQRTFAGYRFEFLTFGHIPSALILRLHARLHRSHFLLFGGGTCLLRLEFLHIVVILLLHLTFSAVLEHFGERP